MTVSPDDLPGYDLIDDNGAVDVNPFQFLPPGGSGDFRPTPVASEVGDTEDDGPKE